MSKHTVLDRTAPPRRGRLLLALAALLALFGVAPASASEADLLLPDLASQSFRGPVIVKADRNACGEPEAGSK